MTRTRVAIGIYRDEQSRFWARPCIQRRYTWRLLYEDEARKKLVTTRRKAIQIVSNTDWQPAADNFASLAKLYQDAGCPTRKLEARTKDFIKTEKARVKNVSNFFGRYHCDEIRLPLLPKYGDWRRRRTRFGTGDRTVDKEFCTLSNILNYGIAIGQLDINWIRNNRPHYRKAEEVRHSRAAMPESASIIHRVAEYFFDTPQSEVIGWLTLFAMFTGCRTSELRRLQMDAIDQTQAGFIKFTTENSGHLFLGRRSKSGLNPWAIIGPEFAGMIKSFQHWHRVRYPRSHSYFPGLFGHKPIDVTAHAHAMARACKKLKLPTIIPHGFRAYYVTKRLRDGARSADIAAEIGDKTVSLIEKSYGDYAGGEILQWIPCDHLPAWLRWQPIRQKVIYLKKS